MIDILIGLAILVMENGYLAILNLMIVVGYNFNNYRYFDYFCLVFLFFLLFFLLNILIDVYIFIVIFKKMLNLYKEKQQSDMTTAQMIWLQHNTRTCLDDIVEMKNEDFKGKSAKDQSY